jgi:nitroreductase
MDVFEAVQERRSVRAYQDKPVSREKLEKILEAGRLAPSAKNLEP